MRRWSLAALFVALVVVPALPSAAADWTRLRSPNFTLEGDVDERQLRDVARRFEQFREVLGRLFSGNRLVTPTPLTVVVFAHDRDFKPVRPLFQGKPVEAVGYALVSSVGTSIAICLEAGDRANPTIYHEYGHLLIANAVPRLPLWAAEGLAEYDKTFELMADGRRAILGRPLTANELAQMSNRHLLPMSELLSADHDSRLYNVSTDRGRFYVQSWALVHYLQMGCPARAGQFGRFVNRVAAGASADQAFAETITEPAKLEAELMQYLDQFAFPAAQFTFAEKVVSDKSYPAEKMSPAEVEASLGQLLLRQQRYPEAQARFASALKLDPNAAAAHTGMGLVDFFQDRTRQSIPALRKGVEHGGGDAMAHYTLGLAALRCVSTECQEQQVGDEMARKAFVRATEILPEFPDALSFLGYTEMSTGGSLDDAERHLKAAIALLPSREDYRFNLAQVCLRKKDFAGAQALLGPIAATSPDAAHKSQARELLGRVAEMKNAAAQAVSSLGAGGAPPSPPISSSDAGRPGSGSGGIIPVYRRLLAGERRIEGLLVSIECPRTGVSVVVRDEGGTHRFSVTALDKVEFLTYRDDLSGRITCGPQPAGMRVYLTSRPPAEGAPALPAGVEGLVVAVEYLPKEK